MQPVNSRVELGPDRYLAKYSAAVAFGAEPCIAGIVSTELNLPMSQQDCSDVRGAFSAEGRLRAIRHSQG
jgi:hypothetical protein